MLSSFLHHQARTTRQMQRQELEGAIRRGQTPAGLEAFTLERFEVPPMDRAARRDAMWLAVDAYLDTLPPPPARHRPWDALRRLVRVHA